MFNAHDVVSLITETPNEQTLSIMKDHLSRDANLRFHTSLSMENIMTLTKFIATTYFCFRGIIYRQKLGTAMGLPVSPIMTNIFMEWLEEGGIATAKLN